MVDLIKLIAHPYASEILEALKKPKRYKELKLICKNDRTLTNRIKELQEFGLIVSVALKDGNKYTNFYELSGAGHALLRKIDKLRL